MGYRAGSHHFSLPVAVVLFVPDAGSVGDDVKVRLKFMLAGWHQKHHANVKE
ncbi:hypothetical protein [Neisseria iguanae]|uniref:hypothetical protein n=1 Tax=Neisseria iguanae TaxID=90242 RepID=UPI0014747B2E|nr:hypothetical protein [Neisseria iguanae]